MGGFYGSIQVRTTDRAAVKAAAERVAGAKKIHCLVGPELNGWVGIYPENSGQDDSFGKEIAAQVEADVLHLIVHDDDVLAYWLWRKHELVDSYWSKPGYFGEENRENQERRSGDPQQFRSIIGDKVEQLARVLDREKEYTFEGDRLSKLAKVLGMSNAVTEYDYLVSDERSGIKAWRKFEKVPPDAIVPETDAHKDKRKSRKSVREKLKKSGHLFYSQEWKEFPDLPKGFPDGDGFVLGKIDIWQRNGEFFRLEPPSYVPQPMPFIRDQFSVLSQGNLAAISSGDAVRILDKSFSPWKLIAEIPHVDTVPFAAISPSGEFIAHRNALKIVIRKLPSGDQVCEIPLHRSGRIVFHPTEKWLVVAGDQLGLICFDGDPLLFEFFVEGKRRAIDRYSPEIQVGFRKKYAGVQLAIDILNRAQGCEEPKSVGFIQGGRLMWCGTDLGLRIYEWKTFPRESLLATPPTIWRFDTEAPTDDPYRAAIGAVEEVDGRGLVFGGSASQLMRLDLANGEVQKIIDLPGGGEVESLAFSRDGNALAVSSQFGTRKGPRGMPNYTRSWEVWDYARLRDSASKT